MKLIEMKYTAERGGYAESYQDIEIVQEMSGDRRNILFKLNERRWRDPEEAAEYLEWAAQQIRTMTK